MNLKNIEKVVEKATIGIIVYLLSFGLAMAFFPIRPFWNDEWRLIYNLKFKNVSELWGPLDLLQQCPRVYLTVLKKITYLFDYSYTSMRVPALIIAVLSIMLLVHIKNRIFPRNKVMGYLFMLILISSQTFTDYLVQVKQYEMEIFLCLVALWQLLELLEISNNGQPRNQRVYFLLCCSFLVAPFFSYTYPISVFPVLPVIGISAWHFLKNKPGEINRFRYVSWLLLPMILTGLSISVFYFIDVRQLMGDNRMYMSYKRMLGIENGENHYIVNFWKLFSLVGSGLLFEIVFGILGIASFLYGIVKIKSMQFRNSPTGYVHLYGVLLLILTLGLVVSCKLIGGVARLTAFTVPAIAFLIVFFLEEIKNRFRLIKLSNATTAILFLGLFGNILSTCINTFTYVEYRNRIKTYWNTSLALKEARLNKLPILFTEGVRGDIVIGTAREPGKVSYNTIDADQIAGMDYLCTEVILKVNPEYKTWDRIPVYHVPDLKWTHEYMNQLPSEITAALAFDGLHLMKLNR